MPTPTAHSATIGEPKNPTPVSTLTAVELFAGAGGMATGAHRAGLEVIDLVEWNEACCETLRRNVQHIGWKDARDIEARDVQEVDFSPHRGAVDVLTAGAPCQPFSNAGHRRGRHDDRNMLPEVVRAIAECRPRAFVIENVRGLLFPSSIDYLKSIVARLRNPTIDDPGTVGEEHLFHYVAPAPSEDDEYRVEYQLLNAADFGLAQNRPRLFIVGIQQEEAGFQWPAGKHSRSSLIAALLEGPYWREHVGVPRAAQQRAQAGLVPRTEGAGLKRWATLRDVTTRLDPPARATIDASDPSHVLVPGARLYGKHTGSRIDWVGKTVKAGVHGSPGGEHIVVTSPKRFRYLTVRECAELQGFPRTYVLPERRTPAMRQLGNAVPVNVAEAILGSVRDCLNNSQATTEGNA